MQAEGKHMRVRVRKELTEKQKQAFLIILCIAVAILLLAEMLILIRLFREAWDAPVPAVVSSTEPSRPFTPPPTSPPEPLSETEVVSTPAPTSTPKPVEYEILPEYEAIYAENSDFIGWLSIADTVIDYPVMQTLWDEEYYLNRAFDGSRNSNGCLIVDADSVVGVGTAKYDYRGGTRPGTNIIIHGHNMLSGAMFGHLQKYYRRQADGMDHRIIRFDSLYEHREYELISVFLSPIYYPSDQVFKYYSFFNAETEEEFNDWYENIKALSLYDTGVEAEYGDEFITLSVCAYYDANGVEFPDRDGRFVVVGKRVQ